MLSARSPRFLTVAFLPGQLQQKKASFWEAFRVVYSVVSVNFSYGASVARGGEVVGVAARDDGGTVISVIDLLVSFREGVDVEPEGIEEVGKLFGLEHVNAFAESQLFRYLQETLHDLDRGETLIWIPESRHSIFYRRPRVSRLLF